MTRAAPLRFLALVLGLWIGARAVMLAMPASRTGETVTAVAAQAPTRPVAPAARSDAPRRAASIRAATPPGREPSYRERQRWAVAPAITPSIAGSLERLAPPLGTDAREAVAEALIRPAPPGLPMPAAGAPARARRWTGSAWLLLRDDRGVAALAPGGTLGGSQAGARLTYRLDEGLALSGRAYLPLRQTRGAEAAAGIDWQPSPLLPLHLLAERRQDVGGAGRSAFALTAYGGASARLAGGVRAEAYAQAGIVGTRSRDLFVDGSVRVVRPVGPVEVGGAAWGAAQPGVSRLDAGPHLSYRLPLRAANIRVQADWRFRIAGDAAPGSGPALTLAADF